MSSVAIVLDANILIRAVLGQRVRQLIQAHAAAVEFFAPDGGVCRRLARVGVCYGVGLPGLD